MRHGRPSRRPRLPTPCRARPPCRSGRAAAAVLAAAAAAISLAVLTTTTTSAAAQSGERIVDYRVEMRIERSGDLVVHEVIHYDFATNARHGILRDIPVRFRYDGTHDRVYPLDVLAVKGSRGTPAGYREERAGSDLRLRIGDPDRTVTGRHAYTISYRVRGALNRFPDHDELYWNGVGTSWPVPVERASVTVSAPAGITQVACFAGPAESGLPCATATSDGPSARFSAAALGPHEGLTVVVAIPTGVVPRPRPVLVERWSLDRAFSRTPATLGATGALLAAVVAGFARLMWRTGRDRRWVGSAVDVAFGNPTGAEQAVALLDRHVPPVELVPPDGLRPGQVGTLLDEAANPLDVTATIVDLAVRGHLRIEEIPNEGWFAKPDWKLTSLRDGSDLLAYERILLAGLFEDGDEVRLSALKERFVSRLSRVQDALYDDAVDRGWFHARPDHVRRRWAVLGMLVLLAGAGLVTVAAARTRLGLVPVPLVIAGLLLTVGARWMPRRTARGTAARRRTLGFRRFIAESEAERARFAEQQNLFSEYLPFAVVFGCTDRWARAFAGLDDRLPDTTSWYVGTRPFTIAGFSESIDGFTVTSAGTIASTPSASGSSGFSGGGASGGGGGGGGGGSW